MHDFNRQLLAARPMLAHMAHKLVRNPVWAEDAISETFVAALERPDRFAGHSQLQTWLVGILKHKAIDEIRRNTREAALEPYAQLSHAEGDNGTPRDMSLDSASSWGDPADEMQQTQFLVKLDKCLMALPSKQAIAFVRYYAMDEETVELCQSLNVTPSNLGVMLHRARRRLRTSWLSDSKASNSSSPSRGTVT